MEMNYSRKCQLFRRTCEDETFERLFSVKNINACTVEKKAEIKRAIVSSYLNNKKKTFLYTKGHFITERGIEREH